jgi:hypothetical protein
MEWQGGGGSIAALPVAVGQGVARGPLEALSVGLPCAVCQSLPQAVHRL